jgi:hypothetical protein
MKIVEGRSSEIFVNFYHIEICHVPLPFYPEDAGNMFLRNVRKYLPGYIASLGDNEGRMLAVTISYS